MSCSENISNARKITDDSIQTNKIDTTAGAPLVIDTNTIVILSNKNVNFFSLKDSTPAKLTNQDIQITDSLLETSVKLYNLGIDSTKVYSGYIARQKYKWQYVPYINSKGEKKVFINCFCSGVGGFDKWKEKLIEVDDGGSCFFNTTVNLTNKNCGPLLINGPG
ncbi:MAG: hypothetical protein ABJB86_07985 [Bacteroidota bacterium]